MRLIHIYRHPFKEMDRMRISRFHLLGNGWKKIHRSHSWGRRDCGGTFL